MNISLLKTAQHTEPNTQSSPSHACHELDVSNRSVSLDRVGTSIATTAWASIRTIYISGYTGSFVLVQTLQKFPVRVIEM